MHFKTLPRQLSRKGFQYTLVSRSSFKAIYQQSTNGKIVGFEILRIQSYRKKADSSAFKVESFPNDEAFGTTAWTIRDPLLAWEFYVKLQPANGAQLEIGF